MSADKIVRVRPQLNSEHEEQVIDFIASSYWGKNRSRAAILSSLQNSLCFSLLCDDQLIGFARVITDQAFFAYLADVFIVENERGKGFGEQLMRAVLADKRLAQIERFLLATRDAQSFYQSLGFAALTSADAANLMRLTQY